MTQDEAIAELLRALVARMSDTDPALAAQCTAALAGDELARERVLRVVLPYVSPEKQSNALRAELHVLIDRLDGEQLEAAARLLSEGLS